MAKANNEYFENVRNRIETIFKESAELQKQVGLPLTQSKFFDSLNKLEEALTLAKDIFGEESDEFLKCAHKVCETCNLIAMVFLQRSTLRSLRQPRSVHRVPQESRVLGHQVERVQGAHLQQHGLLLQDVRRPHAASASSESR